MKEIRVDIKFPQNKINNFTLEEILKGRNCPYEQAKGMLKALGVGE